MTTIISAAIAATATLIVCMINNISQQKSADRKHAETISLIDYKLSELTKKVEKHNNVIERTYEIEQTLSVQAEKIRVCNHRIDDLEKKGD